MSDLRAKTFIIFPMTKAIYIINFVGIQEVKIPTMHIEVVSPSLRTLNEILRSMKNYYIQKLHNIDCHIMSCIYLLISLRPGGIYFGLYYIYFYSLSKLIGIYKYI